MIAWMTKPNALFREVLKRTFDETLDEIRDSISALGPQENNTFFSDDIVNMFGGVIKLFEHIILLEEISKSKTVYQISDYSYLVLHRMLRNFCEIYSDIIRTSDTPEEAEEFGITYRNKLVGKLNIDDITDTYFHDTDFDFDPEIFNSMDQSLKEQYGFNNETYGVVNRMMPHPDELLPWIEDTDEINNDE